MLKLFWYSTVLDLRLDEEHDRLPVAFLSDACDRLRNESFLGWHPLPFASWR